jgi:hypothetical protein
MTLGPEPPSMRQQWAIFIHDLYRNIKRGIFYRVYEVMYTYFIYRRILFSYLFRNIGHNGSFSFHELFHMHLLFRDGNHV